jgi:hypothetical protein
MRISFGPNDVAEVSPSAVRQWADGSPVPRAREKLAALGISVGVA